MKINKIISVLIFLQIFNLIHTEKINNENKKVCIIYYQSKFKTQVVLKLEKKLTDLNIIVTKDFLKNINKYNPDDYDAIIILSGIAAFIPYPSATYYIRKHNYNKKIIYYCAAYVEDAVYGFLDQNRFDALTSASKTENVDSTVNMILEKVSNTIF